MSILATTDRLNVKTGKKILILMVMFLMFAFLSQGSAQSKSKRSVSPGLAAKLQAALNKNATGVPGVTAAILIPKQGMWIGVTGYSNPNEDPPVPVTPNMLFQIGSVTKNFTAALIMKLAEEGAVNLDHPVAQYLPVFQADCPCTDACNSNACPSSATTSSTPPPPPPCTLSPQATIRQALNMTSGVFNITMNPNYWIDLQSNFARFFDPQGTLKQYLRQQSFCPGKDWEYSNSNYLFLGQIIQAVNNTYNVAPVFRRYFFDQYRMKQTFLGGYETLTGPVADIWTDYDANNQVDNLSAVPRTGPLTSAWTAGGYLSTARDLARWINVLYRKKTVLSEASLKEMLTFVDTTGKPSAEGQLYNGFGPGTMQIQHDLPVGDKTEKVTLIGYYGDTQGGTSFAFHLVNRDAVIAFIINQGSAKQARVDLMRAFVTILLSELPAPAS